MRKAGIVTLFVAALSLLLLSFARPGRADTCGPVTQTEETLPIYVEVTVDGLPVSVGSIVEVSTPRGNVVGCFPVTVAGTYGLGFIYGERTVQGVGTLPGLRDGETPIFRVNGILASAPAAVPWTGGGSDETRMRSTHHGRWSPASLHHAQAGGRPGVISLISWRAISAWSPGAFPARRVC